MRIIEAGLAYFALVFGAGFMLGSVRVLFLVPRLGERIAELIETPFMFVAVLLSARFIAKRFALPATSSIRFPVGFLALCFLLSAELLLALAIQKRSIGKYIASHDPVAGSVYLIMLVLFALMPLIITRWPYSTCKHDTKRRHHVKR